MVLTGATWKEVKSYLKLSVRVTKNLCIQTTIIKILTDILGDIVGQCQSLKKILSLEIFKSAQK